MKAVRFAGPEQVMIEEIPQPTCPEGGVLTEVLACAICGSDIRTWKHNDGSSTEIHGHECVMRVIETRADSDAVRVGDRLMLCPVSCGKCWFCSRSLENLCSRKARVRSVTQGGFAQYRPVGREAVVGGFLLRVPDAVNDVDATLVEPLSCVLSGLEKLSLRPDSHVTVIGAGPVGVLFLFATRLRGVGHVTMVDVSPARLEMSREWEPSITIDASSEDPVQAVKKVTDGMGEDAVIVACVSAEAQNQALLMARSAGEVLFFAGLPEPQSGVCIDTNRVHHHELKIMGSRSSTRRHFEIAIDLIEKRRIDLAALVSHVVPLENATDAFALAASKECLRVVMVP